MQTSVILINGNKGNIVEPGLLYMVETPLAIVSVCMPSIFVLFKRGYYHGIPSLFSSQDPSNPVHGQYGKHIGGSGKPVDGDIRQFERLKDGRNIQSRERLVLQTTATQTSDIMSDGIPLDDIQVRKDVDGLRSTSHRSTA